MRPLFQLAWLSFFGLGLASCKDPCMQLQEKICQTASAKPPLRSPSGLCKSTEELLAHEPPSAQTCVSLLSSWEGVGRLQVTKVHTWHQKQETILAHEAAKLAELQLPQKQAEIAKAKRTLQNKLKHGLKVLLYPSTKK